MKVKKIGLVNSFNNEKTIEEGILSLINQDEPLDKILVIDDASTDNTLRILSKLSLQNNKIDVHSNAINCGPSSAVNIGLKIIKESYEHSYVFLQGGDDISLNCRVNIQSEIMRTNPNIEVSVGNIVMDTNKPKNTLRYSIPNKSQIIKPRELFYFGNFVCAPTACIQIHEKKKNYNFLKNLVQLQDFEMWIRYSWEGKLHFTELELIDYNENRDSLSRLVNKTNSSNFKRFLTESRWVYKKFFQNIDLKLILELFGHVEYKRLLTENIKPNIIRDIILCDIYLKHPIKEIRQIGQDLYLDLLEFGYLNEIELDNLPFKLEYSRLSIFDF